MKFAGAFAQTQGMKIINSILNPHRKNLNLPAPPLAASVALTLLLACGCSLQQSYPQTQIRGYINGQPFSISAPKDATLAGFDALTTTNGAIHIHIDTLQCSLNPTNLANAAEGQASEKI
jgi:hypothetical protein